MCDNSNAMSNPLLSLFLVWILTSIWPIIGASGVAYFSGALFVWIGLAIGQIFLLPIVISGGRWKDLFSRRAAPSLAIMGLCGGLGTAIYVCAMAYTTPANGSVIAQVEVIYSMIISAVLLKERPSISQAAAALLVMGGTGVILAHDLSSPRWKGDLMILATPWIYQLSHVAAKRLPKDLDPVVLAEGRSLYAFIFLSPLCLWSLAHGARWSLGAPALKILALQGLLCSSFNFIFWYTAIRNLDLSKATTFLLSYPALTLLFSSALGRDHVHRAQLLGLLMTFAGAAWMARLTAAQRAIRETPAGAV
jgi:drug/metabolite transporter (DMT)-like permease